MQTTLAPTSLESCPPALSESEISRFRAEGYLAYRDVLNPTELADARAALRELTGRLATGSPEQVRYSPPRINGQGNQSGASYQFQNSRGMMQLEAGFDPAGLGIEEIDTKVRKYMNFVSEHPAFERLVGSTHRLRRVVENLIGPDPLLFQEMALVKPAFFGSEKPWHQDNAYFSVAPLDAIIGVWIALDDAGIDNGCMHVIPGGHQVGALRHYHGTDCEIVEGRLDTSKAVPVPIPAGGALFFYGLLPHETPPNRSAQRRRALQFHFRSATSEIVDEEAYNRIFAEMDGTPASCRAAAQSGI